MKIKIFLGVDCGATTTSQTSIWQTSKSLRLLKEGQDSPVYNVSPVVSNCHIGLEWWISIGLLVFIFDAHDHKRRAIRLHLTICNIQSPIRWAITKVIKNYLPLPNVSSVVSNCHIGLERWISIGLSAFGYYAHDHKRRAIQLHLTIRNIQSPIRRAITKVI